jgi:uncharacterized membrane protein
MTDPDPPDRMTSQDALQSPETIMSQSPIEMVPPSLDKALRTAGVDPRDPDVTKTLGITLSMMMASGSLPLPPPDILASYEKACPGLVEKLITWTEEQRKHRMEIERLVITGAEARMNKGQLLGVSVAIVGLCLATFVGIFGNPYVGAVIAIVAIGGPTAAIYLARGGTVSSPPQQPQPVVPAPPQNQTSERNTPQAGSAR